MCDAVLQVRLTIVPYIPRGKLQAECKTEQIANVHLPSLAKLKFGNVIFAWRDRQPLCRFAPVNAITVPFCDLCQQAVLFKRGGFAWVGLFNLTYRLAADFDWCLRALRAKETARYVNRDGALYDANGIPAQNAAHVDREKAGIVPQDYWWPCLVLGSLLFRVARKLFGVGQARVLWQQPPP